MHNFGFAVSTVQRRKNEREVLNNSGNLVISLYQYRRHSLVAEQHTASEQRRYLCARF